MYQCEPDCLAVVKPQDDEGSDDDASDPDEVEQQEQVVSYANNKNVNPGALKTAFDHGFGEQEEVRCVASCVSIIL